MNGRINKVKNTHLLGALSTFSYDIHPRVWTFIETHTKVACTSCGGFTLVLSGSGSWGGRLPWVRVCLRSSQKLELRVKSNQVKSRAVGKGAKPENLASNPGSHIMEVQNRFCKPSSDHHMCILVHKCAHARTHTHIHSDTVNKMQWKRKQSSL